MEMRCCVLFFNVHLVIKLPAEFSPPIGAFMELCSNANLAPNIHFLIFYCIQVYFGEIG